jgi:ATPase subunit of ABC transporter with duplicated ATPase domains
VGVIRIRRLVNDELGRRAAELLAGLPHRRQGNCCGRSELDVVIADDGEILGDPSTAADGLLEESECEQVVRAEPGRGAPSRGQAGETLTGATALLTKRIKNAAVAPCDDRLEVKTSSLYMNAKTMSGGYQQKLVIAKWLATKPTLLIIDEPRRLTADLSREDATPETVMHAATQTRELAS